MQIHDALRLLGLEEDGLTAADVEREFRRRARDAHPDTGGARETWDALEEARRVALANCADPGTALEVRAVRELVLATQAVLDQVRRREDAANTKRAVVRRRTSALTAAKRLAWLFTAVGTVGMVLYKLLEALVVTSGHSAPVLFDPPTVVVTIFVAMFGLVGLFLKLRVDLIGQAVEDLTAELGDRDTYVRVAHEISNATSGDHLDYGRWWHRDRLEAEVKAWMYYGLARSGGPPYRGMALNQLPYLLRKRLLAPPSLVSIARRVGIGDATRLILAKGLEIGAVEHQRDSSGVTLYAWDWDGRENIQ